MIPFVEVPASGPCMILVHGLGSDKSEVGHVFEKICNELKKLNISSLRFDLRGHGESDAKIEDRSFEKMVLDTIEIIDYAKDRYKKVGILGFSLGARVMIKALKYRAKKISFAITYSAAIEDGLGAFQKYIEGKSHDSDISLDFSWRDDLILPYTFFEEIANDKPLDTLKELHIPFLFVYADDDEMIDPKASIDAFMALDCIDKELYHTNGGHTLGFLESVSSMNNVTIKTFDFIKKHLNI